MSRTKNLSLDKINAIVDAFSALDNAGIPWDTNNDGIHVIVYGKYTVDFWPTSGKWYARDGDTRRGAPHCWKTKSNGLDTLMSFLK